MKGKKLKLKFKKENYSDGFKEWLEKLKCQFQEIMINQFYTLRIINNHSTQYLHIN